METMKLTCLKPRVELLKPRLANPQHNPVQRIRGSALQGIRRDMFSKNPLCVRCQEQGRVTVGAVADHIVALGNGGKDVEANRQLLCIECHRLKTVEDMKQMRGQAA